MDLKLYSMIVVMMILMMNFLVMIVDYFDLLVYDLSLIHEEHH